MDSPRRSYLPSLWWWLLLPLVLSAAARDWWAPDEPRYAMIARWIFDEGEFLVLRRCGELYPDKPPLVYWLAGLAGWLTGWSEFAMRLVSVLSIAGVAWMTARLARQWFGELEERWAPVLFLGFALISWNGARLALDPLLTFGCVGALYCAAQPAQDTRESNRWTLLAGGFGGLAMLAKGPPALVNIGLPLLAWRWSSLRADGARAPRWSLFIAVLLTILPVAAWAVCASLREPALWKPLFFGQHLGRAVEGTAHAGPPWQHLTQVPLFVLPWTVPVAIGVVAGARAWRTRRRGQPAERGLVLAFLWFVAPFVFFSITPAKRELYLMSAYPALALLGAHVIANAVRSGRIGAWTALPPLGLFALLGALFALAFPLAARLSLASEKLAQDLAVVVELSAVTPSLPWRAAAIGALFLCGTALGLHAWRAGRVAGWAHAVTLTWLAGLSATFALLVPPLDALKSDVPTARALAALPQRPSMIPCYGTAPDGVRFYGGRPCVPCDVPDLAKGDLELHMAREGAQFLALFERRAWERLQPSQRAPLAILAQSRAGSRTIYIVGSAR